MFLCLVFWWQPHYTALTKILKSGVEKSDTVRGQAGKINEQNILGEACSDLKNSCPFHNEQQLLATADCCHAGCRLGVKN